MIQFHGITALLILRCIILNYGLQRNMKEQKEFIREIFPTFSFVPDSDGLVLHVVLKYWLGLMEDSENSSWHGNTFK